MIIRPRLKAYPRYESEQFSRPYLQVNSTRPAHGKSLQTGADLYKSSRIEGYRSVIGSSIKQ